MINWKLTRKEKLLFIIPCLVLIYPLFKSLYADKFDKAQRRLAGPNAIDCGYVFMNTDVGNGKVDWSKYWRLHEACVAAFKSGKPFRARWDQMYYFEDFPGARPSVVSRGIVRTPQGQVYFVYYGGPYHTPVEVLVPKPQVVTVGQSQRISSSTYISVPFD